MTESISWRDDYEKGINEEWSVVWIADKPFRASEILKTLAPQTYENGFDQFINDRCTELENEREETK